MFNAITSTARVGGSLVELRYKHSPKVQRAKSHQSLNPPLKKPDIKSFQERLELFNRCHAKLKQGLWQADRIYFECKGELSVSQRMCTKCRDSYKESTTTDFYYVNLAEVAHERTILCYGCMETMVKESLDNNRLSNISEELNRLRNLQRNEILLLSR